MFSAGAACECLRRFLRFSGSAMSYCRIIEVPRMFEFNICETFNLYYNGLIFGPCRGEKPMRQGTLSFYMKQLALLIAISLVFNAASPAFAQANKKTKAPAPAAKKAAPPAVPNIETLRNGLKDPDYKKRREALDGLSGAKDAEKLPLLKAAMGDEDPVIRERAARLIGKSRDKSALKTLSDALPGADREARLGIMEGLGDLGDKGAAKLLADFLTHEDRNTRWKAAEVLGRLGSDDGVDALAKAAAEDKDDLVRQAAVESLGKIGTSKAASALDGLASGGDEKLAGWAANVRRTLVP